MDSQEEDARAFLDDLERRWCLAAQARNANAQTADDLFAFVTMIINRLPELLALARNSFRLHAEVVALRGHSSRPELAHEALLQIAVRRPEDYAPWGNVERWANPALAYPDCSADCRFALDVAGDLANDWVICTNPKSHRAGLLTFEHQGCQKYEPRAQEGEP